MNNNQASLSPPPRSLLLLCPFNARRVTLDRIVDITSIRGFRGNLALISRPRFFNSFQSSVSERARGRAGEQRSGDQFHARDAKVG
jgi:hypothetical protein